MVPLLAVGLIAGVVTAISPCVLPVLPVIFAGGATGSRRRAVAIVVGLAGSFALATLFSVAVLTSLGLPLDLLDDVGIALLCLLAIGLLVDPVGRALERPFARVRGPAVGAGTSNGVVLGAGLGIETEGVTDEDVRKGLQLFGEAFRDQAPVTAAEAATIILDGVREGRWRILVGEDAVAIDAAVRADPEAAYEPAFFDALRLQGHLGGFGG